VDETTWLASVDPQAMLMSLRGQRSDRKLRLFACACCRRIWTQLPREANRALVAAIEDRPDGTFDDPPLHAALIDSSRHEYECAQDPGYWAVKNLGRSFYKASPLGAALLVTLQVRQKVGPEHNLAAILRGPGGAEARAHCDLLRDVFGPLPFRRVAVEASWKSPAVIALAQAVYEERRFEDLPVLADALEEAGGTDPEILTHLRGAGLHARGCWVLDLLLGKG
jgi:hypothetical protein